MNDKNKKRGNFVVQFLKKIGPGFITGSADDDPSGIATYTQAGARFGYGLLWGTLFLFPMMFAIQEMVARIGLITGEGLAGVAKKNYSRWIVMGMVGLLIIANTINIGADIGAMAGAINLLIPQLSFNVLTILFCILILWLEIYISYKNYSKILKVLSLTLLSYVLTLLIVTQDWQLLLSSMFNIKVIWDRDFMITLIAVFGTTISPYLFFWQASEEVEEEISHGKKSLKARIGASDGELAGMRRDTFLGMLFSQMIMLCIMGTAASVFYYNGLFEIETTSQAVEALRPLAGNFAALIYAFGVIGVGLLAVPVLSASIAYAVAETFGWREGLYRKLHEARGFYVVIVVATVVGMMMNWLGINPVKALFWAAVVNGVISIPLIWMIIRMANNRNIVGDRVNSIWSNLFAGAALILALLSVVLILIL